MRRTQQNADQQRRRGVRSRLVACVAAVAMLVTSVAAGTAVATELGGGDVADQTTQNTATLEQQGAGNTGGNNQTTTDNDGQADGNQPADVDSGSEGDEGAAGDGTADGNGMTESDGQSQGGTAAKSANAVPAPQSEDADANADAGVSAQADGEGVTLLNEDFTGSSFGLGEWSLVGDSVGLTAAGYKSNGNPYGVGKATNTQDYIGAGHGDGYLQLTDDSQGQTGTVLYNTPVQTRLGLDITFTQWQFGKKEWDDYEADGIGFYLVDGGATLNKGTMGPMGSNVGGALGYSAIRADGKTYEGIANGVLGVGLDIWGNYSAKEAVGGDDARDSSDRQGSHQYSVTVRGAGQQVSGKWTNGYGIIEGARAQLREAEHSYLATDYPTQSDNQQNEFGMSNGVQVNIVISPKDEDGNQTITVRLKRKGDTNWKTVINKVTLTETLPETVKFGFTASTGQGTDAHYVRGLTVKTEEAAKPGIMLTKKVAGTEGSSSQTYKEGDEVAYEFVVTNTGSTTLKDVTVTDQNITEQITGGKSTLAPTETTTFTVEHTLTEEDVASGSFRNVATATGTDIGGTEVTDTDDEIITTVPSLGDPVHHKSISVQCDEQCMYDLSLDVTGAATGSSSQQSADVVIVLDKSTSMNYSMNGDDYQSGTSRWITATNAIGTMLDGLLGEGKNNRVALVTFSGNEEYCIPFFGCFGSNYDDAQVTSKWTKSKNDITGAFGGNPGDNAGTNWEAGLREAGTLLDDARDGVSKYVVFISDGDPTYYYENDGATGGDGRSDYYGTAYDHAVTQAESLDATVFSIGLGPKDNVKKMRDFADDVNGEYYSGASETDLNEAVASIVQSIRTASSYTDVSITDTLSDYVDFGFDTGQASQNVNVIAKYADGFDHSGLSDDPDVPTDVDVEIEGKRITVSFPGFDLRNGVTYTVTFKVKPTQKAFDDATWTEDGVSQAFLSNDVDTNGYGAYLTYTNKTTTTGSDGGSSSDEKTVPYKEKPMFTVPASTVTVSKQWPEGVSHPDSVTIQLQQDGEDYGVPVTLNEENNWSYTFQVPAGPDGHEYSVVERTASGWTPSYEYEVTTSGGAESAVVDDGDAVSLKGLCVQSATATVKNAVNEIEYGVGDHLELNKVFEGKLLTEGEFEFMLTNVTKDLGSNADPAGMVFHKYTTDGSVGDAVMDGATPAMSVTVENGNNGGEVGGFDFGAITFTKPGTYYVKVSEVIPSGDDKEAGVVYDDHALYVKYEVTSDDSGLHFIVNENRSIVDENGKPIANAGEQNALLTWTNRFVSVSGLPLTGGDATARTLLLAGSGVLLVAGVAWLLARRRRV